MSTFDMDIPNPDSSIIALPSNFALRVLCEHSYYDVGLIQKFILTMSNNMMMDLSFSHRYVALSISKEQCNQLVKQIKSSMVLDEEWDRQTLVVTLYCNYLPKRLQSSCRDPIDPTFGSTSLNLVAHRVLQKELPMYKLFERLTLDWLQGSILEGVSFVRH